MRTPTFFLALSGLAVHSLAAIYTNPSQLPRLTYDYVIVGGTFFFFIVVPILHEMHSWKCWPCSRQSLEREIQRSNPRLRSWCQVTFYLFQKYLRF